MPRTRFQPQRLGRLWVALLGVSVVFFLAPLVVVSALPDRQPDSEPVDLTADNDDWDATLDLQCIPDEDATVGQTWDCGSSTISAIEFDDVKDEHRTMERMVRALSISGDISGFGERLVPIETSRADAPAGAAAPKLAANRDVAAILARGTGDAEGKYLSVTSSGADAAFLIAKAWEKLTGKPLSPEIQEQLHALTVDEEPEMENPFSEFGFEIPRPVDPTAWKGAVR